MRTEARSDLLNGWDPTKFRFQSRLPGGAFLSAAQMGGYWGTLKKELFVGWQAANQFDLIQQVVAWDAVKLGFPATFEQPVRELFRLAPEMQGSTMDEIVDRVAREVALRGVALAFDVVLGTVATAVPIAGWIVKIGLELYRIGRTIYDSVTYKPPEAGVPVVVYDKETDDILTQAAIELAGSPVWTRLFLPHSLGAWGTAKLAYTDSGIADGIAFGPDLGKLASNKDLGSRGIVPGVDELAGYWQYPEIMPASSRESGPPATSLGNLLPSLSQFGTVLWQRVMLYGIRMFAVDAGKIRSQWADFFAQGWELYHRSNDPQLRRFLAYHCACGWLKPWGQDFKRGRYEAPIAGPPNHGNKPLRRFESFDPLAVAEATSQEIAAQDSGEPVSMGDLVAYVLERWAERADRCLETTWCAYVSPNAAALANGRLKSKHQDMRRELLRHAAVQDVEIDMVPDAEYRTAVVQARRVGGGNGIQARPDANPFRYVLHEGVLPPTVPLPPGIPRPTRRVPTGGGGGGAALLGLLALGGGAWALTRGR